MKITALATASYLAPDGESADVIMLARVDGARRRHRSLHQVIAPTPSNATYRLKGPVGPGVHTVELIMSAAGVGEVDVTPVKLKAVIRARD